ncbi:MAG: hypothetical protein NVS3B20_24490 [Polyangiales bacterium]
MRTSRFPACGKLRVTMAKKNRKPTTPTAANAVPHFRPLEEKLKQFAEAARAEERAKKEAADAASKARSPTGTSKGAAKSKPTTIASPRVSTLTREEQGDLAAMKRDQGRDDEFFFARLMSGVRPLEEDKRGRITTASVVKATASVNAAVASGIGRDVGRDVGTESGPDLPSHPSRANRQKSPDEEVRDHLLALVEGATRFEVNDDGQRLEGRRLDLDNGTFRRVRRGELSIDARLDLHGKTAADARDTLEVFLRDKRARRDRLVLIIHGRGEHSPGGVGVLRGEIAAWLSQGRASQHVAAFSTARADDGGDGALYVLLRS